MYVEESQYRQCSYKSHWRGSRTGEDDDRSEIRLQVLLLLDLFCNYNFSGKKPRIQTIGVNLVKSTEDLLFEQKQM